MQVDQRTGNARHHVLIAGTGRAGTSFLVSYLTTAGLDTGFDRSNTTAHLDPHALAGLERLPLVEADASLPYVVKSPWICEYIDEIVASNRYRIDAIIAPMRDLVDAATSRSILEHRKMHERLPGMADNLARTWDVFGETPGGTVYSLNPLDQARLLAVSFHRLVMRAVEAEIPLILPAFPRMIADWEYLYEKLKGILPAHFTREDAKSVHAQVASLNKVRVESEMPSRAHPETGTYRRTDAYPSMAEVDNAALRREIRRLRDEAQERERDTHAATASMSRALQEARNEAIELVGKYEAELREVSVQLARSRAGLSYLRHRFGEKLKASIHLMRTKQFLKRILNLRED